MRPLLAATLEKLEHLDPTKQYLLSPKLDGIRSLRVAGVSVSRNMKPIRNRYIQHVLRNLPNGMDGELIVGAPFGELVLNRTVSGVMSEGGEPDFMLYVFDNFMYPGGFKARYDQLNRWVATVRPPHVMLVGHEELEVADIAEYEQRQIDRGYEGIMIRGLYGHYKQGRSTHNDGILWKFKRFRDGEAWITGVQEGVTNNNVQVLNALGTTERSTHKENMVPNGMVGTILAMDKVTKERLVLSPGRMTHDERAKYLRAPHLIIGRTCRYKTFDYGTVDSPRFSTFQAFLDN